MLLYGKERYIKDNGNGYDLYERDAICDGCHESFNQKKYCGIYKDFEFDGYGMSEWIYCPFCGSKLYKEES